MLKQFVSVVSLIAVVAGCSSSSSSSGSTAECFNGVYAVVFSAETGGDAKCPDLTAKPTQWTYVVSDNGVSGSEPTGSTPIAGNTFDENTCKASLGFTKPADTGCTIADSYFFQLTFDAKGFTGTYQFSGCGATGADAGSATPAVVYANCYYPVVGTKQ